MEREKKYVGFPILGYIINLTKIGQYLLLTKTVIILGFQILKFLSLITNRYKQTKKNIHRISFKSHPKQQKQIT